MASKADALHAMDFQDGEEEMLKLPGILPRRLPLKHRGIVNRIARDHRRTPDQPLLDAISVSFGG